MYVDVIVLVCRTVSCFGLCGGCRHVGSCVSRVMKRSFPTRFSVGVCSCFVWVGLSVVVLISGVCMWCDSFSSGVCFVFVL